MDERNGLKEILTWIAAMGDPQQHTIGAYERFVLKYGYAFVGTGELPVGLERGYMGQCFANAGTLATYQPELYAYTEGYAISHGIPWLHAWVTDRLGRVVDPTWSDSTEYYGVLVKHSYIQSRIGLSVIDNWQNRWPLVRSKNPRRSLLTLKQWIDQAPKGH